jgi:para-nitrobenzyl esterase
MESGLCDAIPLATAEAFGAKVFKAAKCDTAGDPAACMRALSTAQVLTALPDPADIAGQLPQYGGVVDLKALLGSPRAVIKSGAHNHVPFLLGNVSDETSRAVPSTIVTTADYVAAVNAKFGASAGAVLAHYPSASYASPKAAYVAVTSDSRFICSTRRVARDLLVGQSQPAYRFMLTHTLQNANAAIKALGAWHTVDVLYLFNELNILAYTPTPAEAAICSTFGADWSHFAATGNPSAAGGLQWTKYAMSDPYLELDTTIAMKSGYRTAQCDFWDSIVP